MGELGSGDVQEPIRSTKQPPPPTPTDNFLTRMMNLEVQKLKDYTQQGCRRIFNSIPAFLPLNGTEAVNASPWQQMLGFSLFQDSAESNEQRRERTRQNPPNQAPALFPQPIEGQARGPLGFGRAELPRENRGRQNVVYQNRFYSVVEMRNDNPQNFLPPVGNQVRAHPMGQMEDPWNLPRRVDEQRRDPSSYGRRGASRNNISLIYETTVYAVRHHRNEDLQIFRRPVEGPRQAHQSFDFGRNERPQAVGFPGRRHQAHQSFDFGRNEGPPAFGFSERRHQAHQSFDSGRNEGPQASDFSGRRHQAHQSFDSGRNEGPQASDFSGNANNMTVNSSQRQRLVAQVAPQGFSNHGQRLNVTLDTHERTVFNRERDPPVAQVRPQQRPSFNYEGAFNRRRHEQGPRR